MCLRAPQLKIAGTKRRSSCSSPLWLESKTGCVVPKSLVAKALSLSTASLRERIRRTHSFEKKKMPGANRKRAKTLPLLWVSQAPSRRQEDDVDVKHNYNRFLPAKNKKKEQEEEPAYI